MNPHSSQTTNVPARARVRAEASGMTLVEMAVAVGVGSLVLLVVAALSVYAMRSFVAMGNYASLDAKNRLAVDRMTRDIQQATGVVDAYQSAVEKWLMLTNAVEGFSLKYTWTWYPDPPPESDDNRKLICEKTWQDGQTYSTEYLSECDEWDFTLYQRTARPNSTTAFYPASAPAIAKAVEMTWKCSRTLLGKKWNTESVQSARIVIRNKP